VGEPNVRIRMNVNGKPRSVAVPPMKRLLDVLREDCRLTGTKEGCGEGECGACTVLIDGRSVNSCLVPAVQADGTRVVTVEGLASGGRLTVLQEEFVNHGGAQCGICTPGILVSSVELLRRTGARVPTELQVREALAGNLCRCTGYQKIIEAVIAAARATRNAPGARRAAKAKAKPKPAAKAKAEPRPAAGKPGRQPKPRAKPKAKAKVAGRSKRGARKGRR
jgi:carbon-monoxide dehydrogenase small subunit